MQRSCDATHRSAKISGACGDLRSRPLRRSRWQNQTSTHPSQEDAWPHRWDFDAFPPSSSSCWRSPDWQVVPRSAPGHNNRTPISSPKHEHRIKHNSISSVALPLLMVWLARPTGMAARVPGVSTAVAWSTMPIVRPAYTSRALRKNNTARAGGWTYPRCAPAIWCFSQSPGTSLLTWVSTLAVADSFTRRQPANRLATHLSTILTGTKD